MTEKQVWDAIISRFTAALATDYPTLIATYSLEDALAAYDESGKWLLVTPMGAEPGWPQGRTNWQFQVQFSCSLQPGSQATTTAAVEADRTLRNAVRDAINGTDGYKALRDAGLQQARIAGMEEDQMPGALINPHVVSGWSFD